MSKKNKKEQSFYEEEIFRHREQKYIQNLLAKYKEEPVNEELKKKIWEELQKQKHLGKIKIPFKVVMRKKPSSYIEIILDTRL